jgi:hypothetical protein
MYKRRKGSKGRARYLKAYINGKIVDVHRYVMEQVIGRPLLHTEHVHHINGDRYDNRPENLQIVTPKEHASFHNHLYMQTPEYRATMSIAMKGKYNRPNYHPSEETKAKTSASMVIARKKKFWSTNPK